MKVNTFCVWCAVVLLVCWGCAKQSDEPAPAAVTTSDAESLDTTEPPVAVQPPDEGPSAGLATAANSTANAPAPTEEESDEPTIELKVGDVELVRRSLMGGKVSILLPAEFSLMDEELLKLKYPSERRPDVVYTNDTGGINITLKHTHDTMPRHAVAAFHRNLDSVFRNLYPSAVWFESGVVRIHGREWLKLDLRVPAIDTEIRNTIVATSVDDRMLLVSFNATVRVEKQWLETGRAIIASLQILGPGGEKEATGQSAGLRPPGRKTAPEAASTSARSAPPEGETESEPDGSDRNRRLADFADIDAIVAKFNQRFRERSAAIQARQQGPDVAKEALYNFIAHVKRGQKAKAQAMLVPGTDNPELWRLAFPAFEGEVDFAAWLERLYPTPDVQKVNHLSGEVVDVEIQFRCRGADSLIVLRYTKETEWRIDGQSALTALRQLIE